MNKKIVFAAIVALLFIISAPVYYLVFKQRIDAQISMNRVGRLFSNSKYLQSQVGESFMYEAEDACDSLHDNANRYNWTESTSGMYWDGGSVDLSYRKEGVSQIIKVYCKWDLIKGYYASATVSVENNSY